MGKLNGFLEFNREIRTERPIKNRIKDSLEVYKEMPEEELKNQGARCMDCGIPFCSYGCPLGNLMPDWNDMVFNGEWAKAYKRLTLTNNFPEFTGRICPALCEGSCTLGVNRDPVSIREIELRIIEKAFSEGFVKPNLPKVSTGKKIAIVGSGPSGLAAAAELISVGHDVTVFERSDEVGGLLRYGIPDFKLEKRFVERRVDILKEEGVVFKTGVNIGANGDGNEDYDIEKLREDFDIILLTGGSTIPRDIDVPGRELQGIYFAMDFLRQQNRRVSGKEINEKEINAKDKVVLVIGGGDTGSDCIGTAIRQGAKQVYQFEIMPKAPDERDETMPWPYFPRTYKVTSSHEEGCVRDFCINTKEFTGQDGKVDTLHAVRVEWVKADNGRMDMKEISGSEFDLNVDMVVLAMGFVHPQHDGMLKNLNISLDKRGNVLTDEKYMTSSDGIFAAGDMRKGQSLVVWAINDGRSAAQSIDKYLMGETSLRG
jgi:glutamate synthase (NADPH) small chain